MAPDRVPREGPVAILTGASRSVRVVTVEPAFLSIGLDEQGQRDGG